MVSADCPIKESGHLESGGAYFAVGHEDTSGEPAFAAIIDPHRIIHEKSKHIVIGSIQARRRDRIAYLD